MKNFCQIYGCQNIAKNKTYFKNLVKDETRFKNLIDPTMEIQLALT